MKAPRLQRVLQTLSLGAFLVLLWLASFRLAQWFLRIKKRKDSEPAPGLRKLKHGLLAACLAASLLGVSPVFWLAPMPLVTRFWGLAVFPVVRLVLDAGRPAWRRSVSEDCTRCGACIRACPMGAIPEDPRETRHRECIACLRCVRVCPEGAARFRLFPGSAGAESFVPGRRQFLASSLSGAGLAALALSGLDSPALKEGVAGTVVDPDRVRPPGALPEEAFLTRCLRCGECVAACPTNTLQPAWLQAGVWGLFSPIAVARRGACDPDCAECGRVCPTGALRPLPLGEKMWAKMGTAQILLQKCLAWEWGKPCLVCKGVCPYGTIEMRRVDSSPVTVPFVLGTRCVGCGACENRCQVQATSAIQVEPMGSLRLASGSFEQTGRGMGLDIRRAVKPGAAPAGPENLAPGTSPFDPAPSAAAQPSPFDPAPGAPSQPAPFDPPVNK